MAERTKQPRRGYASKIATNVVASYMAIALFVATPYFNWQYAKENGFLKWLLLGEVVPTAKAIVWPYFMFVATARKSEDQSWTEFRASHEASYSANELNQKILSGQYSQTDINKRNALLQEALNHAMKVNPRVLDKVYLGFGKEYTTNYVNGLQLTLEGINSREQQKANQGAKMMNDFMDWFDEHKSQFRE